MRNIKIKIAVICSLLFSCQYNENDISVYLNQKEIAYEKICVQKGREVWNYYTDSNCVENNHSKELFAKFFGDQTLNENITKWYRDIDKIENDTLKRRIEIWGKILICAKVNFEPKIIDIQNDLEKKLADYPNVKFSDKEIEDEILELVKLRNEKAKELGYSNYAYMVLQNTGIDTAWFENLIQKIDKSTFSDYNKFLNRISRNKNKPEYSDLRSYIIKLYELDDLCKSKDFDRKEQIDRILNNIGIDLNVLPIQFKFNDLPPGMGGFGNAIEIPNDFRVVAMKELSFHNILHEIGHGLQWTNVKIKSPVLKGYEWCMGNIPSLYYEAMAETIAKFSDNRTYVEQYGYTKKEIDSLLYLKKELGPLYLRYKLVNCLFEIELYKNPDKPAATIKHDLYKKYLSIERDFTTRSNLIFLSYVSYPVYEQNYLISDIISWQIHDYLKKEYGDDYVLNEKVGVFLKLKLWNNGELMEWHNRILDATGKPLDLDGYIKSRLDN